jgi:histidyl-tRNA synthetase
LSDKKIDKTELKALHYILYNNKNEEIIKSTNNLSDLSTLVKYIPIQSDKYRVRNRINKILKLTSKNNLTKNIEKSNKIQSYNILKKESKIL